MGKRRETSPDFQPLLPIDGKVLDEPTCLKLLSRLQAVMRQAGAETRVPSDESTEYSAKRQVSHGLSLEGLAINSDPLQRARGAGFRSSYASSYTGYLSDEDVYGEVSGGQDSASYDSENEGVMEFDNDALDAMLEAAECYKAEVAKDLDAFGAEPWPALARLQQLFATALSDRTLRGGGASTSERDSAAVVLDALAQVYQGWQQNGELLVSSAQSVAGSTLQGDHLAAGPARKELLKHLRLLAMQQLLSAAATRQDKCRAVFDLLLTRLDGAGRLSGEELKALRRYASSLSTSTRGAQR